MSHFQSHKTYMYENTWMINFPLISSVKLHSRPTHLTEHSLITFRCCFSILTETLNPNTHHAIVLHLPQRHHVMETWSVLLPLKPLALGCCVYSRSVCWCSQVFPGRCTPGSSPCVPASSSTADRWSRACSKTSAASRRRSTLRSWSRTACHSCSRSSDPARSLELSFIST